MRNWFMGWGNRIMDFTIAVEVNVKIIIVNIITDIRLIIMCTSWMVVSTYLFSERQLSVTAASPILRPIKRTNMG